MSFFKAKRMLLEFIPPLAVKLAYVLGLKGGGWEGNFKSWDDARKSSTGYDNKLILEKVRETSLRVKNKEIAFERDSVAFDRIEYSWPLLSGLMWAAVCEKGRLNIIDFGGSLGSTYFQLKKFLDPVDFRWNIIEQEHFVECGKRYFEDGRLKFYKNLGDCFNDQGCNVAILSGVLQYIEKPYMILEEFIDKEIKYLIFDRTTFNILDRNKLVVQKIKPSIFPASYPCWFLRESDFKSLLNKKYSLIEEFLSFENRPGLNPIFKGFI